MKCRGGDAAGLLLLLLVAAAAGADAQFKLPKASQAATSQAGIFARAMGTEPRVTGQMVRLARAAGLAKTVAGVKSLAAKYMAAQADAGGKRFGGAYFVQFFPGIGCTLWTTFPGTRPSSLWEPPLTTGTPSFTAAAIIAINPRPASFIADASSFTCTFTPQDVLPPSPGQLLLMKTTNVVCNNPDNATDCYDACVNWPDNCNHDPRLYVAPADLATIAGQVHCSYPLFYAAVAQTNVTDPATNETTTLTHSGLELHYDPAPPAVVRRATPAGSVYVACKVNPALAGDKSTSYAEIRNNACFPGDATVTTPAGPKPISQLRVGERVLAVDPASGALVFDAVYLTPHRDGASHTTYVNIHASTPSGSSRVLRLSARHYVPTACAGAPERRCLKHAGDVVPGDSVWLVVGAQAVLGAVDAITHTVEQGLFSPWTLTGAIVVDGVAASTHTAWPGEAALLALLPADKAPRVAHLLASAHQAIQAPLRALFRACGAWPLHMIDGAVYSVMEAGKASGATVLAAAVIAASLSGAPKARSMPSLRLATLVLAASLMAQPAVAQAPQFAGGYFVMFSPGVGCMLWSGCMGGSCMASPGPAALLAVNPQLERPMSSSSEFKCKFMPSHIIPPTPAQTWLINNNHSRDLYVAPSNLSSLYKRVHCSYGLISQFGWTPEERLPGLTWYWDPAGAIAQQAITSQQALSVTCRVNASLVNVPGVSIWSVPFDACFPGDATVTTPAGPKPISQLRVGERVLAVDPASGALVFDAVYLTPHRDGASHTTYVNIHASTPSGSSRVLRLSARHYVPTACAGAPERRCLKHAGDVVPGDSVWLVVGAQAVLGAVDAITHTVEQGLFSPWTLTGAIVVDGVAASTHTAWPGEAALLALLPADKAPRVAHLLASAHQAIQAPLRALFRACGAWPLRVIDGAVYSVMEAGKASSAGAAVTAMMTGALSKAAV